jgi:hypothetical protein
MKYVAGRRVPGKSTDAPRPAEFTEFSDAVRHLVMWVERLWDGEYEASYGRPGEVGLREAADARWLPIHTALHNATPAHPDAATSFTETAAGFEWFITPKESK